MIYLRMIMAVKIYILYIVINLLLLKLLPLFKPLLLKLLKFFQVLRKAMWRTLQILLKKCPLILTLMI